MTLKGYSVPRTPEGRSSLVPYPPWHYVGVFLVVDYWADPESPVAFLPEGIDPHPDPGRCAFVAADWQSCSERGDELVDPSRSQYKEVFVVVNGLLDGEEVTVCSYIWVDRDFALTRGWIQGFPKKLGSIWITRPVRHGKAGPRLEPGGRFGASVAVYDRRIIDARFTITGPADSNGFVNALPMLHHRFFPSIEEGSAPSMNELVTMKSYDWEGSNVWTGDAELEFGSSPVEELESLAPVEMIAGYWRSVGVTWGIGTRLA